MSSPVRWWYLSCARFTVAVATDADDLIIEAAPIVRRFTGQPSLNLGGWMRRIGGFRAERLA